MPEWDSDQYSKFINERTQPAYDLASKIKVEAPMRIVDMGCGPGNSTEILFKRWQNATISAFDSSPDMLKKAKVSNSEIEWFQATIENWNPKCSYDIIFSNAVLQWVKSHNELFPSLLNMLNEGGALAVQMPAHYKSPLHKQLIEVAEMPEWSTFTKEARNLLSLSTPSFYYNLLSPLTSHLEIWETQYFHVMENPNAILEWFRGTGLRPFLEALPTQKNKSDFEEEILNRYTSSYPQQKNGKVLFPFNRFFFVGYK